MSIFTFKYNNPSKAAEAGTPYAIIADLTFVERIKINTGIKIKHKHFNPAYGGNLSKIVKPSIQKDGINRFQKIKEFEIVHERITQGIQLFIKGSLPQFSNLKDAVESYIFSGVVHENNLIEKFNEFIQAKEKEGLESRSISAYKRVKKILLALEENYPEINFDVFELNEDFFYMFREYASSEDWNSSTFNKYLTYFKAGLDWIAKRYYSRKMNLYYKDVRWMPQEKNTFYLTPEEVSAFKNYNFRLEGHKLEQEIFILQMSIGRRHSDLMALKKSMSYYIPDESRILIVNKKGKKSLDVIVPEIAKTILDKYLEVGKLPLISDQKRNEHLKEMFKLLDLPRVIQITKFSVKDNEVQMEAKRIHEIISTHWARSTFVTYLTNQNIQNHVISLFTGQNDATIKKYQGKDFETMKIVADKIKGLFDS